MKRRRVSRETRIRTLVSQGFRCRYCGTVVSRDTYEVDHILPVARGGGNWRNLACSCMRCNRKKGVKEWLPVPLGVFGHTVSIAMIVCWDWGYITDHIKDIVAKKIGDTS